MIIDETSSTTVSSTESTFSCSAISSNDSSSSSWRGDTIDFEAKKEAVSENSTPNLIKCEWCGRSFGAKSLVVHHRSCTKENPAKRIGAPLKEKWQAKLAERICSNLLKLKENAAGKKPSKDDTAKVEMSEINFKYADEDSYEAELAELYSYSEMKDWDSGLESFHKYTDSRNFPRHFKSMEADQKKRLIADVIEMLESTKSSVRLEAARLLLYILQGAYGDFRTTEEEENEINYQPSDKGTGGFEHDCLLNGAINAYFCYEQGLYPALCTILLYEIVKPSNVNFCAGTPQQSSMSNSSKVASNIDLADNSNHEHRSKQSATLADNESLRIVLSCIYHMLAAIRRKSWIDEIHTKSNYSVDELINLRKRFLIELEEPLDIAKVPLLIVLFDMMPSFTKGQNPHYPMKKVLLLIWKIILTTLGGFEELKNEKNRQRKELNLPVMEDTIEVGSQMKAIRVSCDGDYANFKHSGTKPRVLNPIRSISRQLACISNDGLKEPDEPPKAPSPSLNRQHGNGSSDNDDGSDELPDVETDVVDEVLSEDKKLTKADVANAKAEESSPPIDNSQSNSTPVNAKTKPRFAGNIPYQDFHVNVGGISDKSGCKKSAMPWSPKVSESEVETFIQRARMKFLGYTIPGDLTTTFALPPSINLSLEALHRHLYKPLAEIQISNEDKYNRFPFTQKETISNTPTERLYVALLPKIGDYFVALLKILLAALPNTKLSHGDSCSIFSDVLTPETVINEMLLNLINSDRSGGNISEDDIRVTVDIARHKEIIVKSISGILIILLKWLKLNHIYQFEFVVQHFINLNCIPLLLKFLDQNMVQFVQAKNELPSFNYPSAPLFFVRNHGKWPILSSEKVGDSDSKSYYLWRNVFSSINLVRVLNKITKGRQSRIMMLVIFKSAPILKRCLKVKCGLFQLYCLKLLKIQSRYLGNQWRKANMDLVSAIYLRVRHRLADNWAYAHETQNNIKELDAQNEEKDLKLAVEKFHSRRYGNLYSQFKIDMKENSSLSKDYFNFTSMEDFVPVDNCLQSLLNTETIFSERFKRYYETWLNVKVYHRKFDWDTLLENSKGILKMLEKNEGLTLDLLPTVGVLNLEHSVDVPDRISNVIAS